MSSRGKRKEPATASILNDAVNRGPASSRTRSKTAVLQGQANASKRSALGDISNTSQMTPGNSKPMELEVEDEQEASMTSSLYNMVDVADVDDPLACTEHVADIYNYLVLHQYKYQMDSNWLEAQPEINDNMMAILVDWLVEVAEEYNLLGETLHLAKLYVERFLSQRPVNRSQLQLVGVAATLVAAKYEEIYPPGVEDFVYISDNTYTREDVIEMETMMLNELKFCICQPTPLYFLQRFWKVDGVANSPSADAIQSLSLYLIELTLPQQTFTAYVPSYIAMAAMIVTNHQMKRTLYSQALIAHSGINCDNDEQLKLCVQQMHKLFRRASRSKLRAVTEKYSRTKFQSVAMMRPRGKSPM